MKFFSFLLAAIIFLAIAPPAHAIIIVPALLLIPLAKIVAVLAASFVAPFTTIGIFLAKAKHNRKFIFIIPLFGLLLLTILVAVFLRLRFPYSPWF